MRSPVAHFRVFASSLGAWAWSLAQSHLKDRLTASRLQSAVAPANGSYKWQQAANSLNPNFLFLDKVITEFNLLCDNLPMSWINFYYPQK